MKPKFLLLVAFILLFAAAFGNDTTYYDKNWLAIPKARETVYYKVTTKDKLRNRQEIRYYYASGQLKYETEYDYTGYPLPTAKLRRWYSNGQLHTDETRIGGKLSDTLRTYYDDGKLKRLERWHEGEFVSGDHFDREGNVTTHTPYIVEPKFPGGSDAMYAFIGKIAKHPKEFLKIAEGGETKVAFMVLKDGRLANIRVMEATAEPFGKEALRVVKKMPRWNAGSIDGNPDIWEYILPLNFAIEEKE